MKIKFIQVNLPCLAVYAPGANPARHGNSILKRPEKSKVSLHPCAIHLFNLSFAMRRSISPQSISRYAWHFYFNMAKDYSALKYSRLINSFPNNICPRERDMSMEHNPRSMANI